MSPGMCVSALVPLSAGPGTAGPAYRGTLRFAARNWPQTLGEGGAIRQTLSGAAAAQVDCSTSALPGRWLLSKTACLSSCPGKRSTTELWPLLCICWGC